MSRELAIYPSCSCPFVLSVEASDEDVCGFGWLHSLLLPLSTTLTFPCGKLSPSSARSLAGTARLSPWTWDLERNDIRSENG